MKKYIYQTTLILNIVIILLYILQLFGALDSIFLNYENIFTSMLYYVTAFTGFELELTSIIIFMIYKTKNYKANILLSINLFVILFYFLAFFLFE